MMMNGCGGGMLLWSLVFLVLVVGGIWLAVRAFRGSQGRPPTPPRSSALQILEDRFTRGEIDQHELEERRRSLNG